MTPSSPSRRSGCPWSPSSCAAGLLLVALLGTWPVPAPARAAISAAAVLDYHQGSLAAGANPAYSNTSAALGLPSRMIGLGSPYPGTLSPFNPPFQASEILQIGPGGSITLRLSGVANVGPGRELGLFSNVFLWDTLYPMGVAGNGPPIAGHDRVVIELSADNVTWHSLGLQAINIPHNAYRDLPNPYSQSAGAVLTDFDLPFNGSVAAFSGKSFADIKALLGPSAGGNWFDAEPAGLSAFQYVRLSLPPSASHNFELDAVVINRARTGPAAPGSPDPTARPPKFKVKIVQPRPHARVEATFQAEGRVLLRGSTATVARVEFRIASGPWTAASLEGSRWSAAIAATNTSPKPVIEVRAITDSGLVSKTRRRKVRLRP